MISDTFLKTLVNRFKGVAGSGDVLGELVDRYGKPMTMLEPADAILSGQTKSEILKQIYSPIAYDLWYFVHKVNMLSGALEGYDHIPDEFLNDNLSFLQDKLQGVKPYSFLRDLESLVLYEPRYWEWQTPDPYWQANTEFFIHLMAYEMWSPTIPAQCESAGADTRYGFDRDASVGYLAFPVGQLGVMEVISILKQTELEIEDFNLKNEHKPILDSTSQFFFTPADNNTGKNYCFGDHIVESGYIIPKDKRGNVEYLNVTPISTDYYNDVSPQFWFRYWINKEEKFPVPGEFVGILVKPLALPPHAWWFQKTSPFLYAGNYVETHNLTSGVITDIIPEEDRGGGIGDLFKVLICGYEVEIDSSDFKDYDIGERVGILKTSTVTNNFNTVSFMWGNMVLPPDNTEETYIILPISFYKEEV